MSSVTRRGLLAVSALLPLARALPACGCEVPAGPPAAGPFARPVSGRELMRRRYFPDVVLTTHEGKQVRFYEDLLKDKVVVLNLMYANCQGACPVITANLARVQKILVEQGKRNVFLYSLTVKPEEFLTKDNDIIGCEVECRRDGIDGVFVDLTIPGLSET